MIKYLLLGLIIYAYYKFFLKPKRLDTKDQQQIHRKDYDDDDSDYVDYEEVE